MATRRCQRPFRLRCARASWHRGGRGPSLVIGTFWPTRVTSGRRRCAVADCRAAAAQETVQRCANLYAARRQFTRPRDGRCAHFGAHVAVASRTRGLRAGEGVVEPARRWLRSPWSGRAILDLYRCSSVSPRSCTSSCRIAPRIFCSTSPRPARTDSPSSTAPRGFPHLKLAGPDPGTPPSKEGLNVRTSRAPALSALGRRLPVELAVRCL